jgi:hypothetical protein
LVPEFTISPLFAYKSRRKWRDLFLRASLPPVNFTKKFCDGHFEPNIGMIEKIFWSNLKILVKFENFWKISKLDFKTFQNFYYDDQTLETNSIGELEFFV